MFSSLLRPGQHRPRRDVGPMAESPASGPAYQKPPFRRHATADFTEADDDDEESQDEEGMDRYPEDGDAVNDEDNLRRSLPVLPLFSAAYLDSLPIYNITHAIRMIVQTRTETTLTWDQLRSPQVSQFLVKPMQQQIRTQHFSRATLYALMANCLQFHKEGQLYPGNIGISTTRARVCELLALKLLKEYNTRELIDALSYDYYPLQGLPGLQAPSTGNAKMDAKAKAGMLAARTSTLEVAIRASAKYFLAHPLVVQQLEAIWNGAITFYSSADSLHRKQPSTPIYAPSSEAGKPGIRTPLLSGQPRKEETALVSAGRRTVILYDPRQASLFKLSRLRVPRYRFFLSTLSLLVLIGLFLAVLSQRSTRITSLELVFWFWSAGFMLDELVGFNEQGFSLYIMSFWNIFDLGILVLLIVYYFMRVYGVFLIDPRHWNNLAYDVLAANAILLLPRIFSVLDHYQYFSQLLIAFRLMALDLAAVLVLVTISCSGFFVFFTMATNSNDASEIAFKIFQILMGFTPAAWDVWPEYNFLERALMALFLIICHFVVVTILITVLTNSFMKIASNANQEHQFLFALNTISMVKNDALFSYVAPGNIFAWLLMPIRYCMPLQHFVQLNRTIIKATHFPLLFCIYVYERFWLAASIYEPTDLIDNPGRGRSRTLSMADPANRTALFSPNVRVREESVVGYQKDYALEEVFRRGPGVNTLRSQRMHERRKTQNAIRNWMDQHDEEGGSSHHPQDWPTANSKPPRPDWQRRFSMNRDFKPMRSRQFSEIRSAASDPADLMSQGHAPLGSFNYQRGEMRQSRDEVKDHTDADGDDELVTNDEEEEDDQATNIGESMRINTRIQEEDYFTTPMTSRFGPPPASSSQESKRTNPSPRQGTARRTLHSRTLSTNTILYAPQDSRRERAASGSSASSGGPTPARPRPLSARASIVETPMASGQRSPRRQLYMTTAKPRPILPQNHTAQAAPTRAGLAPLDPRLRPGAARRLSSIDLSAMSDNLIIPDDPVAGVPSSFQTQMAMALMKDARLGGAGRGNDAADRDRMSRLVLARMKTLEESFADVARELRGLKTHSNSTAPTTRRNSSGDELNRVSAFIEVAGKDRRKVVPGDDQGRPRVQRRHTAKRPVSRRSMKENKVGLTRAKSKGKEVAHSSDPDSDIDKTAELDESSYSRRGSSF